MLLLLKMQSTIFLIFIYSQRQKEKYMEQIILIINSLKHNIVTLLSAP